ncbi:MAG: flagellar type III secretion system pore protein FliP [Pseudomonadota bacterium]
MRAVLFALVLGFVPGFAAAQDAALPLVVEGVGTEAPEQLSLSLQILVTMTLLTLLPALLLSMSAFVRMIIVLSILRQALGTAQTPPNQVLIGISLFLTFFVMSPVINTVNADAVQPYRDGSITMTEAVTAGLKPVRTFMLDQTRDADLKLFANIAGHSGFDSIDDVPLSVVIPAFMVSELKTAFQIGFLIFIPFLIIDLVVSSVLMSMGMMMLSPMLISLPFKLMLFVLVDGWALLLGTLASSFYV